MCSCLFAFSCTCTYIWCICNGHYYHQSTYLILSFDHSVDLFGVIWFSGCLHFCFTLCLSMISSRYLVVHSVHKVEQYHICVHNLTSEAFGQVDTIIMMWLWNQCIMSAVNNHQIDKLRSFYQRSRNQRLITLMVIWAKHCWCYNTVLRW